MRAFAELFRALDQTTSTKRRVTLLAQYFEQVSDEDKVWTIALFSGKRPRRTVTTRFLREWAAESAGISDWLFDETYHIVGDLAETIAKIIPQPSASIQTTQITDLQQGIAYLLELKDKSEAEKKTAIQGLWGRMDSDERFLINKLITGGFRIGVSQRTIVKALSLHLDQEESVIAHKLMGDWDPATTRYEALLLTDDPRSQLSKPYPFYLAHSLDQDLEALGLPEAWQAEYKWDGIRGQIVCRQGEVHVWSRGEELVTKQYPEFQNLAGKVGDVVLDGELVVWGDDGVRPFHDMQKRIGRKRVSAKMMSSLPVVMIAYDIMEYEGADVRSRPQSERRRLLEEVVAHMDSDQLLLSELISFATWSDLASHREKARDRSAEGLMLKSVAGPYKTGRKKGDWYKWKVDPMTVDAVMLYAQRGHGRRANLYTDFTFAVLDEAGTDKKYVPFAKAYSGLTDDEFSELSRFVRKHTVEKFGPVCSVVPELVFEIAFEGIAPSSRHKCGIAVRFPRILRWRRDKPVSEINTLTDLKAHIKK